MINYSIVKRSVNANLIEINQAKSRINQAKSRINQAKKEGKTPQITDLAAILYLSVGCIHVLQPYCYIPESVTACLTLLRSSPSCLPRF